VSRGEQTLKLVEQSSDDFIITDKVDQLESVPSTVEQPIKSEADENPAAIARSTSVENLQIPVKNKDQADRALLKDKRCKVSGYVWLCNEYSFRIEVLILLKRC
jgi:hypothetical protein